MIIGINYYTKYLMSTLKLKIMFNFKNLEDMEILFLQDIPFMQIDTIIYAADVIEAVGEGAVGDRENRDPC